MLEALPCLVDISSATVIRRQNTALTIQVQLHRCDAKIHSTAICHRTTLQTYMGYEQGTNGHIGDPEANGRLSRTTLGMLTAAINRTDLIQQMHLLTCASSNKSRTTVLVSTGGDQLASALRQLPETSSLASLRHLDPANPLFGVKRTFE